MRQRLGQIAGAATAAAGVLILTSCSTTTDVPETSAATVTVTGEANLASAESGECTIGANRVAPGDRVVIFGDTGSVTSDEVKNGAATYRLLQNASPPAGDGIGSEVQDSDGTP
ncbi:hypothetical protein [Rhodococcus sp. USK13]|uniref:hypothetical protein n=1 Tax=Rhodococcus sp. USK13 TaxID=2806442 RepID=UPI002017627F|nr:hypothetical protein [Rhodococcus sp. USK13]